MNILMFPEFFVKSGVGMHVKQLSEELRRQGHTVTVISFMKALELDENIEFIEMPVNSKKWFRIWKTIIYLRKIIKEKNINIVHCHHRKTAFIMHLYNIFFRIPFVYTAHSARLPKHLRRLTFVGKRAIAISQSVRKTLVEDLKVSEKKIIQIPNGVFPIYPLTDKQIASRKAEWGIPADKYVFSLHSRIDRIKNHLLVVEVVNQLSNEEKEKIIVVCSGEKKGEYYKEVLDRIHQLGLDDLFLFVGWAKTEDVLGISDFMLLPSINEGFALTIVEAFMVGVPTARTKTAGFEEQKYCFPIDAYDPKPTIEIIRDVLENGKDAYRDRIEKAREFAFCEFTVEIMTKRTVDVYKEACGK